jgi:hypothetical protein
MRLDKRFCRMTAIVALAAGLLSPAAPTQAAVGDPNPGVLPVQSNPHGRSYAEWAARWWQWAFSLPVDQSPFFDENGSCANGASGQSGSVWFLTGVINVSGTATRDCTVPTGKALFFPILNFECSVLEGNGTTEEELRACARPVMDTATGLLVEVDGVPLQELSSYRVQSPLFTYGPLPPNSVLEFFGVPGAVAGATSLAVDDGYYLMLAPLPQGAHTIRIRGALPAFNFTLDVTYRLTVAGSG